MRTLCDVCESAAALLFCAADEAALCLACDHKVHMCNKLASRHVRVGLDNPVDVPRCDICENSPAFFYCEVDGSSLCLQCDMSVHVGGKRKHVRYLLLRQRVKFPGDEPGLTEDPPARQLLDSAEDKKGYSQSRNPVADDDMSNHFVFQNAEADGDGAPMNSGLIDLNVKFHCEAANDPPG